MTTQLRTIMPSSSPPPPAPPGGHQLDDDDPLSSSSSPVSMMAIATSVKVRSTSSSKETGGAGTAATATVADICVDDIVTGQLGGRADDGVLQIVRPRASAAAAPGAVGGRKGGRAGMGKRLSRPKLPMSGYNLFVRDERELLRRSKRSGGQRGGSADVGRPEVKAAINERWRKLDRRTKERYNKRGRDEMARYRDEMELYKKMAGDDEYEAKEPKRLTPGVTEVNHPTTPSASAFQFVPIAASGADGEGDVDDLEAAIALASYATLAERAEENRHRRIRENEATLAALARKEDFVLFLRILTKHLQLVDPDLHVRARRVVRECVEAYRREYGGAAKQVLGDSSYTPSLSVYDMADRLRDAVGPKHFARAEAMANAYSYRRGGQ